MQKIKTIYFPHYFAGEYDLVADLDLPSNAWLSKEIEPDTWRIAIQWKLNLGIDEDDIIQSEWEGFIKAKYPGLVKYLKEWEGPITILALSFTDETDLAKVVRECVELADIYAASANGSDDIEDYCPGTLRSMGYMCRELGFPGAEKEIEEIAKDLCIPEEEQDEEEEFKAPPVEVIAEFLGGVELQGSEEEQVRICEQITSVEYNDMETVISTIEGFVKNKKVFDKYAKQAKKNEFYKRYFRAN